MQNASTNHTHLNNVVNTVVVAVTNIDPNGLEDHAISLRPHLDHQVVSFHGRMSWAFKEMTFSSGVCQGKKRKVMD